MRQGLWAALFAVVLSVCVLQPAAAQTDPVGQAQQLIRQGKPQDAYRLLAPLAVTRAGDPAFDYALGLAAADSGQPVVAIMALQRVLALQPNNNEARAELARAYALAGDAETARKEFGQVIGDPTIPDPVRQRFNSIIGALDRNLGAEGQSLTGFFEAGLGYDSNVNTATERNSILIPLFAGLGPASLSGSAVEQEDGYGQFLGGVSVLKTFDRQNRVFASVLGSAKVNDKESAFNTAGLTATAGYAHTFATRSVLALSAQGQEFWFSGDRYRESVGGSAQYTLPLGGAAFAASVQYFEIEYPTDALRNADRMSAGLTYSDDIGVVGLQLGREETDNPLGDHFSHDFANLSAGAERKLFGDVVGVASLGFELRDYKAADPLFLKTREDRQLDLSLSLQVPAGEYGGARLSLRPQVSYTRNSSNVSLYEYDRVTASISLRAEF